MTRQIYKDLENKTVIVTGASRGIGASIAKEFLSQGAKVIVISRTEIPWLSDFDNKKIIVLNEDIQNLFLSFPDLIAFNPHYFLPTPENSPLIIGEGLILRLNALNSTPI